MRLRCSSGLQEFAHLMLDDIAVLLRRSTSTPYTLAGGKEQLVQTAAVHLSLRATTDVDAQVADVQGVRTDHRGRCRRR